MNVDLPEPVPPISPIVSPCRIVSVMSLSASSLPLLYPNDTWSNSMAGTEEPETTGKPAGFACPFSCGSAMELTVERTSFTRASEEFAFVKIMTRFDTTISASRIWVT
ncbi:hypothetical protein D3C71_1520580 [compost metagenome]